MVATRDIADAAAKALKARDWKGVIVCELLGPRDFSYAEATRILGARINKPDLQFVQFSYADTFRALVEAGLSESFAGLYVEMTRAFNEGKIKPRAGRTPESAKATSKYIKDVMKLSSTVGRVPAWDRGLRTRDSRRYQR
jgi:uncharacterized protein YbjT (DUF2867 family)